MAIYNAGLLELVDRGNDEDALGYVDDVAILAVGDDLGETTDKLSEIMNGQDGGLDWSKTHNSKFEVSKSVVMHATRAQRNQDDNNAGNPRVELDGQLVEEVESFKYLGIYVDNQLRWTTHLQKATEKATNWALNFRRLTRPSTGVSSKLMRQLYIATVIPKMTYGLDVWYTPPTKPLGYRQNIGSVAALRQMTKIQRIATLAITGGIKSTPTDLLDAHAGVLPIELGLQKICHRATVRMATLPNSHPLYRLFRKAARETPRTHKAPIDELLRIYELNPIRYETIRPAMTTPDYTPPFSTKIACSRNESMKHEQNDQARIKVFSDGSGYQGKIGAAAVLYRRGQPEPQASLRYTLGDTTTHTTYDAELTGGVLAMWLLKNAETTLEDEISVYTDNQSIIKADKFPKPRTGQTLLNELISVAKQVPGRITIHWISGHTDVGGNEEADKQAKEASLGQESTSPELPMLLRRPLAKSASAEKQAYHAELKRSWLDIWDESPRKARFQEIDPDFPFTRFRKVSNQLNRAQANLLVQIRTGHIPLNYRLHKIRKSETDKCPNCIERRGGARARETLEHFLFECRAYRDERAELLTELQTYRPSLQTITNDPKKAKALLKYVARTGRLKGFDASILQRNMTDADDNN